MCGPLLDLMANSQSTVLHYVCTYKKFEVSYFFTIFFILNNPDCWKTTVIFAKYYFKKKIK